MRAAGLVSVLNQEYARAPEFRYLNSWVRREASAVFGTVTELPADEPLPQAEGPVLIVDGRSLLTRRSLGRMVEVLHAKERPVVPVPLAHTDLAADRPIYTLRGFELREEAFLSAGVTAPEPVPPLPALLLSVDHVRSAPAGVSARSWLEGEEGPLGSRRVERAGLCHRFADYYGQAREDVIELIAAEGVLDHHPEDGVPRLLEVGCGRGATGRLLQERLGCRVTGVELNPVVAGAAARHLHRVVPGDFQEVAGDLVADGPFDALLATELFEHLTDQEGFLQQARRLVRPGGRIVLSVPNVGHYSVVEDLLAGRWDYLPIGLLCYTHYRFFTRRTLEDWLTRCGFPRFRLMPQETELPERWRHPAGLPEGLEVDRESLRTKGFYVVAVAD